MVRYKRKNFFFKYIIMRRSLITVVLFRLYAVHREFFFPRPLAVKSSSGWLLLLACDKKFCSTWKSNCISARAQHADGALNSRNLIGDGENVLRLGEGGQAPVKYLFVITVKRRSLIVAIGGIVVTARVMITYFATTLRPRWTNKFWIFADLPPPPAPVHIARDPRASRITAGNYGAHFCATAWMICNSL